MRPGKAFCCFSTDYRHFALCAFVVGFKPSHHLHAGWLLLAAKPAGNPDYKDKSVPIAVGL